VGQNAADIVFMGDSLAPVSAAIRAARRTQSVVRQNFILAIGYNAIAVPFAIVGLVTPLIAALAMSGSSLFVVANALRLRNAAR
jgi:P-type Cu2+ transporter